MRTPAADVPMLRGPSAAAAAAPESAPRQAAPGVESDRLQPVLARCVAARASGGAGLLQRKIDFASYISEALGWYADVPKAMTDFESLKRELQQLMQADVPAEIRSWLTAQSTGVAAFVNAWDDTTPVPTSERAKVIAAIGTHRGTLATLSGQIETKKSELAARELEEAEQRKREERAERREREKLAQLERDRLAEAQRVKDEQAKEEQRQRDLVAASLKEEQARQAREQAEREALEREAALRQALEKELAELGALYGPEAVARRRKIRRELREREAATEDELMKAAQSKLVTEMAERHQAERKGLNSKRRKPVTQRHEREVQEAQEQAAGLRDEARQRREKQARADEAAELLVQIGLVEPEVERLLCVLDGFDTTEGLALAAEHAAAARGAAGRARAAIAEDVSAAGDELMTATAAIGSLADSVTQAGIKRATVQRRRENVRNSSRTLLHKGWPPRKHLAERLAAHDKLTPAQRIASLTDDTVVGGIAMLEFEIDSAAEVDGELRAISSRVRALKDTGVFLTWATATAQSMFRLGWEDLARSMHDEGVPSGIAALRLGLVQMERLKGIRDDILTLKLPVLRDELLSHADRTPPESWELQVERLAELERDLADARDIDRRRAGAADALVGATLDTNQRRNIETWLAANAALSLTEQRQGIASDREHGLKRIQAAVARYNSAYGGTQEADAAAEAERREAQRRRDRSTAHLISGTRTLRQLYDDGLISRGRLVETFKSNYDSGEGEFSVEYTIEGLHNILVHAHCDANGTPKAGNAVHWKERRYKYVVGHAHPVPDTLRPILLDEATELKNNRDRNPKINTL